MTLCFIVLQAKSQVYLLTVLYVVFINHSPSASLNPLALWMKSTGRYSVYQIVSLACLLLLSSILAQFDMVITN